jgi:type IV pilus modification protein PilV
MKARGVAMTEVLVALALLAVALTGALALALRGYALTSEARRAEQAAALAADLAGRMRALPRVDWTDLPAATPCAPACAPETLAALEFEDWQALATMTLPGSAATLEPGMSGAVMLTLGWSESGGVLRELSLELRP